MRQEFKISVFGIIKNEENRVLLCLRNDYNIWNLPGGGLEKGETPWQGIIREVKEETGLNIEVIKLIGVYSKPNKDEIVFSFECNIIDGELILNEEAKDIKYFSLDKIPENTVVKQVERIKDYFENQNKTVLKIQQTEKTTIELLKDLAEDARVRLKRLGYNNVVVKCDDGYKGWGEHAPFDCIIVTAAPEEIPEKLVNQLKMNGRMVLPVGKYFQDLVLITKTEKGYVKENIISVRFVPMVKSE